MTGDCMGSRGRECGWKGQGVIGNQGGWDYGGLAFVDAGRALIGEREALRIVMPTKQSPGGASERQRAVLRCDR